MRYQRQPLHHLQHLQVYQAHPQQLRRERVHIQQPSLQERYFLHMEVKNRQS